MNPGVLSQLNYGTVREAAQTLRHFADAVLSRAQRKRGARQVTMDKWRDRTEALHAGNRTRSAGTFAQDATPSLWWRITDQLRPIEIGLPTVADWQMTALLR